MIPVESVSEIGGGGMNESSRGGNFKDNTFDILQEFL
jgi:hypothetical protein